MCECVIYLEYAIGCVMVMLAYVYVMGFGLLYTCILRVSVRLSIHVVYVSPLPRYLGVFVTFLPIEAASLWAE